MPSAALAALVVLLLPLAFSEELAEDLHIHVQGETVRGGRADLNGVSLCLLQQRVKTFEVQSTLLAASSAAARSLKDKEATNESIKTTGEHPVATAAKQPAALSGSGAIRESTRIITLKPGHEHEKVGQPHLSKMGMCKVAVVLCTLMALLSLTGRAHPKVAAMARAVRFGGYYIIVSSVMIESNKWLMQSGRFPYPFTLTFNHMLSCTILANLVRKMCPSLFPALQGLEVTPRYCLKFLGLGVPFMFSVVCGNWAYKYLSVSFLQIMKQTNVVTIYVLSVIAGLEALRRCSVMLLLTILAGAMMAVRGELHFVFTGFMLQVVSSWSEALKVVFQSFLMSGQAKLDPLTLLLFMAPACFVANLVPWAIMEGPQIATIASQVIEMWPLVLGNMILAFILNIAVAQCIKEVSAVGFLLCGIVKDNCIILMSTFFLGESLAHMQQAGFTVALAGVALYSLYKQNLDCFKDDNLYEGFRNVYVRLMYGDSVESLKHALSESPEVDDKPFGSLETCEEEARQLKVVH